MVKEQKASFAVSVAQGVSAVNMGESLFAYSAVLLLNADGTVFIEAVWYNIKKA